MLELNNSSLNKSYLIRFFCNRFRLLIKIQIENYGKKLWNWKDLVQKAIKVQFKAGLHSPSMIRKIDQQVTCSKQLIVKTFTSSQKTFIKDLKAEKSRLRANKKVELAAF